MEIPTECVECVGDSICDTDVERGQGWCLVFHKALEEKLKADNSASRAICGNHVGNCHAMVPVGRKCLSTGECVHKQQA